MGHYHSVESEHAGGHSSLNSSDRTESRSIRTESSQLPQQNFSSKKFQENSQFHRNITLTTSEVYPKKVMFKDEIDHEAAKEGKQMSKEEKKRGKNNKNLNSAIQFVEDLHYFASESKNTLNINGGPSIGYNTTTPLIEQALVNQYKTNGKVPFGDKASQFNEGFQRKLEAFDNAKKRIKFEEFTNQPRFRGDSHKAIMEYQRAMDSRKSQSQDTLQRRFTNNQSYSSSILGSNGNNQSPFKSFQSTRSGQDAFGSSSKEKTFEYSSQKGNSESRSLNVSPFVSNDSNTAPNSISNNSKAVAFDPLNKTLGRDKQFQNASPATMVMNAQTMQTMSSPQKSLGSNGKPIHELRSDEKSKRTTTQRTPSPNNRNMTQPSGSKNRSVSPISTYDERINYKSFWREAVRPKVLQKKPKEDERKPFKHESKKINESYSYLAKTLKTNSSKKGKGTIKKTGYNPQQTSALNFNQDKMPQSHPSGAVPVTHSEYKRREKADVSKPRSLKTSKQKKDEIEEVVEEQEEEQEEQEEDQEEQYEDEEERHEEDNQNGEDEENEHYEEEEENEQNQRESGAEEKEEDDEQASGDIGHIEESEPINEEEEPSEEARSSRGNKREEKFYSRRHHDYEEREEPERRSNQSYQRTSEEARSSKGSRREEQFYSKRHHEYEREEPERRSNQSNQRTSEEARSSKGSRREEKLYSKRHHDSEEREEPERSSNQSYQRKKAGESSDLQIYRRETFQRQNHDEEEDDDRNDNSQAENKSNKEGPSRIAYRRETFQRQNYDEEEDDDNTQGEYKYNNEGPVQSSIDLSAYLINPPNANTSNYQSRGEQNQISQNPFQQRNEKPVKEMASSQKSVGRAEYSRNEGNKNQEYGDKGRRQNERQQQQPKINIHYQKRNNEEEDEFDDQEFITNIRGKLRILSDRMEHSFSDITRDISRDEEEKEGPPSSNSKNDLSRSNKPKNIENDTQGSDNTLRPPEFGNSWRNNPNSGLSNLKVTSKTLTSRPS